MEGGVVDSTSAVELEYKPDIERLKKLFEDSQSLTRDARSNSFRDDDYYNGVQLTAGEKRVLALRGQPDNVFNRVRPAVNGTLGVIKQGQTDPRAYPRNPQDQDAADVASKVLRYIADDGHFDALKIDAAKHYLVEGICAAITEVDEDRRIVPTIIRFEEFFYDPYSRRQDFSDARYMGIAKWRFADDVRAQYPEKGSAIEGAVDSGTRIGFDDTFADRPSDAGIAWADKKRRRIMVVEIYHNDDGWKRCVFVSGAILEAGDSPYTDRKRRPMNPIEAQACFIDRENSRYGIVRDMIGPQDEINKRRNKLLHLITVSQIQAVDPSAVEVDSDNARKEAARPDGVIPFGWQKVPTNDAARGQAELLAEAKSEIERMAPSPAVIGRDANTQSGRATQIRAQAGLTEQAVIFGGVEEWEQRMYRQFWARAQQFWTAPMFIRVTDDEGSPDFIGVNQPQMGPPEVVMGEGGMPMLQPTVLGYENNIAELDVDIILDSVPDTANLQAEQFQMLTELANTGALGPNPGPLLLQASTLPNKREIMEKLEAAAQQPPSPEQELGLAKAKADIEETQSKTVLNTVKAQVEQASTIVQSFEAGHRVGQSPPPGQDTGASAAVSR
jgi:hypothetical protein